MPNLDLISKGKEMSTAAPKLHFYHRCHSAGAFGTTVYNNQCETGM